MQRFCERGTSAPDEIWLVEHPPVFTQGQAGKALSICYFRVIFRWCRSTEGGQVTYHGPGQLVAYLLLDVRKLGLACVIWSVAWKPATVELLARYGAAAAKPDALRCFMSTARKSPPWACASAMAVPFMAWP